MKRFALLLSLCIISTTILISGCTSPMGLPEKQNEKVAARNWYLEHLRQQGGRPNMSIVGYDAVRIHAHRADRGELSLNRHLGMNRSEIPAPREVLRNPARWPQPAANQPAVMQLKSSPRQRVPEETIF